MGCVNTRMETCICLDEKTFAREPIRLSDIFKGLSFHDIIARSMCIRGKAVRDTLVYHDPHHCDICNGPMEGYDALLVRELYPLAYFPSYVRQLCMTCAAINHEANERM